MDARLTLLGDDGKIALLVIEQSTCTLIVIADPTTPPYWSLDPTAIPLTDINAYIQTHFAGWYMCAPNAHFYNILDAESYINALC